MTPAQDRMLADLRRLSDRNRQRGDAEGWTEWYDLTQSSTSLDEYNAGRSWRALEMRGLVEARGDGLVRPKATP